MAIEEVKITEKEVADLLNDEAHVLVTQPETVNEQEMVVLRRLPLSVLQKKFTETLDLRAKTIRVTNFPATEPPTVTVGVVREDDSAVAYVVALDDTGYPAQVTTKHGDAAEDWVCAFSWEGFDV